MSLKYNHNQLLKEHKSLTLTAPFPRKTGRKYNQSHNRRNLILVFLRILAVKEGLYISYRAGIYSKQLAKLVEK
jgi:hypothetical protein